MRIAKFLASRDPQRRIGCVEGDQILTFLDASNGKSIELTDLLHSADPFALATELAAAAEALPLDSVRLLAPIDRQEVWGAGVTYERSKVARQEESEQGGSFYDMVYRADRPELFFKSTPSRVSGPGEAVRVRRDSNWSVPEPELALVLNANFLELVGYTIGNDMSARDIEGRNPLYLPQAKVYAGCCGLGPWITLRQAMPPIASINISLSIERAGKVVYEGSTPLSRMARPLDELISWLRRDNVFPDGAILLTGTGIVPPDEFGLEAGDFVRISIDGIGTLAQPVVKGG